MGSGKAAKVTIVVVTSNLRRPFAARCIDLIKRYTSGAELMVLDNSGSGGFSHPREMNRSARAIETDYVAYMDDDVHVGPGWLEGLLAAFDDGTAAVTPVHRDRHGLLSYSGIYVTSEIRHGEHLIERPRAAREVHTYCSALVLIDRRKAGSIAMDDRYSKYFFDHAHGLELWEAGHKVICTPDVEVTHLSGATVTRFSPDIEALYTGDRKLFEAEWIESGRLEKLEKGVWSGYPHLKAVKELSARIESFRCDEPEGACMDELRALAGEAGDYNLLRNQLVGKLKRALEVLPSSAAGKQLIERSVEDLVAFVPGRGGAATAAPERLMKGILVRLLGASGYLSLRRRIGDYLRGSGGPKESGKAGI